MGNSDAKLTFPNQSKNTSACPVHEQVQESPQSACPIHHQQSTGSEDTKLSKKRVESNILGKTENEAWVYPSSDMFYKALKKKNKADEETKKNVDEIVSVHNAMNEETWRQILQYEALSYDSTFDVIRKKIEVVSEALENGDLTLPIAKETVFENIKRDSAPRLVNFTGRPNDKTPKALFEIYVKRNSEHFDRHDWIVQRRLLEYPNHSIISERRYVIDYYYDKSKGQEDKVPKGLHDAQAVKSIRVDARPALDSFSAAFDRIKYQVLSMTNSLPDISLIEIKPERKRLQSVEQEKEVHAREPVTIEEFKKQAQRIQTDCKTIFEELDSCGTEQECSQLSMSLLVCMGKVVCNNAAKEVLTAAPNDFEGKVESLENCLNSYEKLAKNL